MRFLYWKIGLHTVDVLYNKHPVVGSPFVVKAYNLEAVTINPITARAIGQPVNFTGWHPFLLIMLTMIFIANNVKVPTLFF